MCKMMEDLRNESEEKGIFKGKAELILNYMKKHQCDAEAAMDELDVSMTERVVLRPMLTFT